MTKSDAWQTISYKEWFTFKQLLTGQIIILLFPQIKAHLILSYWVRYTFGLGIAAAFEVEMEVRTTLRKAVVEFERSSLSW